jgi:DNA mismatch repair protein MutS2
MKLKQDELEAKAKKLEEKREKELQRAREEAREIIHEAMETADDFREELKEIARLESMGERTKRFDEGRRKLRRIEKKNRNTIKRETNDKPVDPEMLKLGERVKILTLGQNGEICELPDDKGDLQVQVGAMKIGVNVRDIMLIDQQAPKAISKKRASGYGSMYRQKAQTVSTSIDVRGKNLDDALMDVEKYIDDAFISGLGEVTIIHGRGEGILSKGIRAALRKNKNIKDYRRGAFDEGGEGVTVVKFK